MSDVLFAYVRDDAAQAEALAEMFDAAGFSIGDSHVSDVELDASGAAIVVWSEASCRSRALLEATRRFIDTGRAVIVSLTETYVANVAGAPVFDLSSWCGSPEDPLLDPLFDAVCRKSFAARAQAAEPNWAAPEPEHGEMTVLTPPPRIERRFIGASLATPVIQHGSCTSDALEAERADLGESRGAEAPTPAVLTIPDFAPSLERGIAAARREEDEAPRPRRRVVLRTLTAAAVLAAVALALNLQITRTEAPQGAPAHVEATDAAAAAVPFSDVMAAGETEALTNDAPAAADVSIGDEAGFAIAEAEATPPPVTSWGAEERVTAAAEDMDLAPARPSPPNRLPRRARTDSC